MTMQPLFSPEYGGKHVVLSGQVLLGVRIEPDSLGHVDLRVAAIHLAQMPMNWTM